MKAVRSIAVVLFHEFELLDVFGPLEMFGMVPENFDICMVAEGVGEVASRQGPKSIAEHCFSEQRQYDILLVPGGKGTRKEVDNQRLLDWIRDQSTAAEYVTSVCTGSALLARAGVLDGVRATTNKRAFAWATSQSDKVIWEKQARWVEDGKFFTSSGVSAGMDMSLALIAGLLGEDAAEQVAMSTEYEWHRDASWDPFARIHGLV
ncbi:MAG: DJ-1/PfpI family protein [Gammaproteobacteria bacterium]|jgi:putative intracellular protease/amidase|nr:DJ-1/PfpI family protein [Gammaproteobacteria bacterium]MDX2461472.1 DJ-1/PfpI family protein [Gammaproteobacteria bacterium]